MSNTAMNTYQRDQKRITELEAQLEAEKNHSDQLQRSLDRAYELKQALEKDHE